LESKGKVVVAMSGGVDSSVTAGLLQQQGYEVVGFFMRTGIEIPQSDETCDRHRGCCSAADAADARLVAGKLGINFYALNFQQEFDQLIDYFVQEYKSGRTPNPCVICNNDLKFGKLIEYADSIDAHWVATGHYARIERLPGHCLLKRAVDHGKDQSYFLFGLEASILDRVLFPVGELPKEEVRKEAERLGLPVHDKPDSVEICFAPDRDYARIVRERDPQAIKPGQVIDAEGKVVGEHPGVVNFTIGQRRGLGIAFGVPTYVTELDASTNTVRVGSREDLLKRQLIAGRVNWLYGPAGAEQRVEAKIRYQHQAAPATVECLDSNRISLTFDQPQSAITPGQAVVLYDQEVCLGGGWIQEALR